MKVWWSTKAQPWLKRNWQWILLPVGLLMVLARIFAGRKTAVVSSELTGASQTEREATERAAEKILVAETKRDQKILDAQVEHRDEIQVLVKDLEEDVPELVEDPQALNEHLKSVGKKVRKR